MEMIAMLGGLGQTTTAEDPATGYRLPQPPPVKNIGVSQPIPVRMQAPATGAPAVMLVSVFAVGTLLGFFLGRSTR